MACSLQYWYRKVLGSLSAGTRFVILTDQSERYQCVTLTDQPDRYQVRCPYRSNRQVPGLLSLQIKQTIAPINVYGANIFFKSTVNIWKCIFRHSRCSQGIHNLTIALCVFFYRSKYNLIRNRFNIFRSEGITSPHFSSRWRKFLWLRNYFPTKSYQFYPVHCTLYSTVLCKQNIWWYSF